MILGFHQLTRHRTFVGAQPYPLICFSFYQAGAKIATAILPLLHPFFFFLTSVCQALGLFSGLLLFKWKPTVQMEKSNVQVASKGKEKAEERGQREKGRG